MSVPGEGGSPAATADIAVVGGGILGTALTELLARTTTRQVVLLEKEPALATHQTGHNSGVVHAGIYYTPGSLKAQLCRRGSGLVRDFCRQHGLPYKECGKVIVAASESELPRLAELFRRGQANGVPDLAWVDGAALARIEPHVAGLAGIYSPRTAVVDYAAVTRALAAQAAGNGAVIRTGFPVEGVTADTRRVVLSGPAGKVSAARVVICAGLQADRLAQLAGDTVDPAIVPFRGEYYLLTEAAAQRVRGLVYPVPDPRFPFLGVHLTRRVDGGVLVGPNAVLAGAREGYGWSRVDRVDLRQMLAYPGLWRLAARHWRAAGRELASSLSRAAFAAQARRYLPSLRTAELRPGPRGVRAQAVERTGELVDDFRLSRCGRVVAVRNAPSPGATSAMALAETIAAQLE